MNKVEVIQEFTLKDFDKLQNVIRYDENKNKYGKLYVKDIFECDDEMYNYLNGNNKENEVVVKLLRKSEEEDEFQEKEPKKSRRRKEEE